MKRDPFQRFVRSEIYANFVSNIEEAGIELFDRKNSVLKQALDLNMAVKKRLAGRESSKDSVKF